MSYDRIVNTMDLLNKEAESCKKEKRELISEFLADNKHLTIKSVDITNKMIRFTNAIVDSKMHQDVFNQWKHQLIVQLREIEKEIKYQKKKWEEKLKE